MLLKNKFLVFVVISFFAYAALLFSEERASILQTLVLEDFELTSDGTPKRYWTIIPDRFGRENSVDSGASLQELRWIKAWPEAYFGVEKAGSGKGEFFYGPASSPERQAKYTEESATSLGIKLKFNRQGYRVAELYPLAKAEDGKYQKSPIPFKGKVKRIDFWVWGSNYDYFMEMVLIDYRGFEHRLNVGSLKHAGWKNFVVEIPASIPQSVTYVPKTKSLTLSKLVIWTNPNERVSGATYYIDHIEYLADVYEELYDGYRLGDPSYVKTLEEEAPVAPSDADIIQ